MAFRECGSGCHREQCSRERVRGVAFENVGVVAIENSAFK